MIGFDPARKAQQPFNEVRCQARATTHQVAGEVLLSEDRYPVELCPDVPPPGRNQQRNHLGRWQTRLHQHLFHRDGLIHKLAKVIVGVSVSTP